MVSSTVSLTADLAGPVGLAATYATSWSWGLLKWTGCGAAVPSSILFLGRPGVGKTTVIREMARVLSDELHKRVVIVDTSNEIGGDGDVPHPAIGGARRMQVPDPSRQHNVMVCPLTALYQIDLLLPANLSTYIGQVTA